MPRTSSPIELVLIAALGDLLHARPRRPRRSRGRFAGRACPSRSYGSVAIIVWTKKRREWPSRSSACVAERSRSTRAGSVTPNTVAIITSRVIASICGSAGVGRPIGPARKSLLGLALHGLLVAGERASVKRRQLHFAACACARGHRGSSVRVGPRTRWCAEALASAAPRRSTSVSAVNTRFDVLGVGQAQPRSGRRGHRDHEAVAEALAAAREPLRG